MKDRSHRSRNVRVDSDGNPLVIRGSKGLWWERNLGPMQLAPGRPTADQIAERVQNYYAAHRDEKGAKAVLELGGDDE